VKIRNHGKLAVTALAVIASVFAVNSHAATVALVGSSTIGSSGVTITGADLNNPGLMTVNTPFYGTNTGDFSPFPSLAQGGVAAFFNLGALDLTKMTTFDIVGPAAYGAYSVTSLDIIGQSANFLQIYTSGIITPGTLEGTEVGGCKTGLNTCADTEASMRWSFTESGSGANTSISASGTFNSPGIPLPEPAIVSLILVGLAGWKMTSRKIVGSLPANGLAA
jgi:hypothetical protein